MPSSVLADLAQDALDRAAELRGAEIVTVPTDVSKIDLVNRVKDRAYANNAGTSTRSGSASASKSTPGSLIHRG